MKNRLISIIMCIMLGAFLIGCSGGNDSGSGKEDSGREQESSEEQTIDKDFSIQMTDSYTYKDPEDLDFDQRFVLVGDESCKLLSDMSNMGYTASNIYLVLYVQDGTAVGEYQYFVTPDEASAAALAEFYTSQGQQITQEQNVIHIYSDADTIQAAIITFASMDTISDETPEAYIEMMKSFNGLVEYE